MTKVFPPVYPTTNLPETLDQLKNYLDLSRDREGIIGFGAIIDAPEYDSIGLPRLKEPFFVVRGADGTQNMLNIHSEEGKTLLAECGFAASLLLAITDEKISKELSTLEELYWTENEDVTDDHVAHGFDRGEVHEAAFFTDGRMIAAWNTENDIVSLLDEHLTTFLYGEDEAGDEDDLTPLEKNVQIYIPKVQSAHEAIELMPTLRAYVATLNHLAAPNDKHLAFSTPTDISQ